MRERGERERERERGLYQTITTIGTVYLPAAVFNLDVFGLLIR
jgi:hypothetical protein